LSVSDPKFTEWKKSILIAELKEWVVNDLQSQSFYIYCLDVTLMDFIKENNMAFYSCPNCMKKMEFDKSTNHYYCKIDLT